MKYKLLFILFLFGFSQAAKAIDASVSFATFKGKSQNYIEVYLHVLGSGLHYKTEDFKTMASIETLILLKQGEDIIKFDKYILNSPPLSADMSDTLVQFVDFMDMKRFGLENGDYTLEVTLKDIHSPLQQPRVFKKDISINYDNETLKISDVQPIESFTKVEDSNNPYVKNGFVFESHPFNYYPQEYKLLKFYIELYNGHLLNDAFYIRYYIRKEGKETPMQLRAKRLTAQEVHAMILQLDITEIPSGNYQLVIEARNRNHENIDIQTFDFQRSNPFLNQKIGDYASTDYTETFIDDLDEKQVRFALKALVPKMNGLEIDLHNNVLKTEDMDVKKRYLYNYWLVIDPQTPRTAFKEYMELALKVHKMYKGTVGLGFETDRGYAYLKYGEPNDIIQQESDPTAPPYEIWEYYELNGQQNVKFVFANQALSANDYELIHSTLRGEINNPNWMRALYDNSPVQGGNYLDETRVQDGMGRNAGRIFDQ